MGPHTAGMNRTGAPEVLTGSLQGVMVGAGNQAGVTMSGSAGAPGHASPPPCPQTTAVTPAPHPATSPAAAGTVTGQTAAVVGWMTHVWCPHEQRSQTLQHQQQQQQS